MQAEPILGTITLSLKTCTGRAYGKLQLRARRRQVLRLRGVVQVLLVGGVEMARRKVRGENGRQNCEWWGRWGGR